MELFLTIIFNPGITESEEYFLIWEKIIYSSNTHQVMRLKLYITSSLNQHQINSYKLIF